MFALEFDGLDQTSARFDAYPAELGTALAAKAAELAAALVDRVKSGKLAGEVLKPSSGTLRSSIVSDVSADADGVHVTVGSDGSVKYAAIQEYGGKTGAHEILPVKAEALAFVAGGVLRFARKVGHPGSVIPERSYLRSTLEEMRDDIVAALADAATECLERA